MGWRLQDEERPNALRVSELVMASPDYYRPSTPTPKKKSDIDKAAKMKADGDKRGWAKTVTGAASRAGSVALHNPVSEKAGSVVPKSVRKGVKSGAKGTLKGLAIADEYTSRPGKALIAAATMGGRELGYQAGRAAGKKGKRLDAPTPMDVLKGKNTSVSDMILGKGGKAKDIKNPWLRGGFLAATASLEVGASPGTWLSLGTGATKTAVEKGVARAAVHEAEAAGFKAAAKSAATKVEKVAAKAGEKEASKMAKVATKTVHPNRKLIASRLREAGKTDAADNVLRKGARGASNADLDSVGVKFGVKVVGGKNQALGGKTVTNAVRAASKVSPASSTRK